MPRKGIYPKIGQVIFCYVGTNEDYNNFLKATIYDYLGHKLETFEDEDTSQLPKSKKNEINDNWEENQYEK